MRFLMLDRITALDRGKRASAVKNVTLSEDFFTYHFPEQPIMPGALIIECMVQLADWLIRENQDFDSAGLPAGFETIKFYQIVRPGDQLNLQVEVLDREDGQYRLSGQAQCGQQLVASARFTMKLVPTTDLQPAEDARRFFDVIRRD
jgi:3-hydroxyacyl-[acyl-carrier-protein] dehydratase